MPLELTNTQVLILKTLLRNPRGLTRDEISEKAGVLVNNDTLGPVYVETEPNHPDSLVTLRLVLREKRTPDDPVIYTLSSSGRKAAESYSARKRGANDKVPADVLNPVVRKIRPLKPYGIENFTDDDIKEIRTKLPDEYSETGIDSLRRQIANQRKIGAYAKDRYEEPEWYKEYRTEREYQVFAEKVKALYDGCAICGKSACEVYHRRFRDGGKSIVYQERAKDGILLCGQCHKRNYRFMVSIPESAPDTFAEMEG